MIAANKSLVFLVLLLLFMSFPPSNKGQDIIIYSDTWLDVESGYSSNPEEQQFFIVGGGVVEMVSDYYHTVDVRVTTTGPQGRISEAFGSCSGECNGTSLTVVAPISLKLDDPPDIGDFETTMQIDPTCSGGGGPIIVPGRLPVGLSFAAFFIEGSPPNLNCNSFGSWYSMVEPCDAACRPSNPRYFLHSRPPGSAGACFWAITPFTIVLEQRICSPFHAIRGNIVSCVCLDIVSN